LQGQLRQLKGGLRQTMNEYQKNEKATKAGAANRLMGAAFKVFDLFLSNKVS
jgi:hypothetical protein